MHIEIVKASKYYKRRASGVVLLVNGHPTHTSRAAANRIVEALNAVA